MNETNSLNENGFLNPAAKMAGSVDNKLSGQIKISLASPETIRAWSHGEVKKPETINYRTFKPERDGLFCAKIFGPIKDYECLCGKYKRHKHKGLVCEKCGVEVTKAKVRRERMGHIELAAPVAHIWFLKSLPSRIGLLTDIKMKDLESVLYFEKYIVLEPGLTDLKVNQLLTEEEYQQKMDEHGEDSFTVGIGAEALQVILKNIDLEHEAAVLRDELKENKSEQKRKKIVQRLKLVEAFIESKSRPEWMILNVLPVIPPDLRPLVPLDGGRFATSDLNDLYRRVINRNNRLKRLLELHAPEIIVRNEKRMLQEAVDALFDNGRRGRAITGTNKRPLKSLADMLKGKQGRFRQNLLGKRVDFSGRSVIVVGPELRLYQCGLPKKMALELFKPFVYSKLIANGKAATLKQAKRLVEKELPEVWDLLEEIIYQHPVLLNRAPTLHRLGIQAFEPVLIEGKAIQLHPLVCAAFNADFDGDQMAVHVPLSIEAQAEARTIMLATNNILSPANGKPIIVPSQDMVLGIYYLSTMREGQKGEGMTFTGIDEVELALFNKLVTYQTKVKCRLEVVPADAEPDEKGNYKTVAKVFETTPGRVLLSRILPKHPKLSFEKLFNKQLKKKDVAKLIGEVYRWCDQKETTIFADAIKSMGYKYAAISGTSFGKDDMIVPESKWKLVNATKKQVETFEKQYMDGLITSNEKTKKAIDAWTDCADTITNDMMKQISHDDPTKPVNSVWMMADSGARGSKAQMGQLGAMRGLMAKAGGAIIETPVIANFKEGLSASEYFNSSHGARKGLSDTAMKTANAGYLTRRLVDVASQKIIVEHDCGTERGEWLEPEYDGTTLVTALSDRIFGRTLQQDIEAGDVSYKRGTLINREIAEAIEKAGIEKVYVRSPGTCECKNGFCAKCYGMDLARNKPVDIGEPVGIIAAQSIGEPGTQLTLRTFHSGGQAEVKVKGVSVQAVASKPADIKGKVSEGFNNMGHRVAVDDIKLRYEYFNGEQDEQISEISRGSRVFFDENTTFFPLTLKQKDPSWAKKQEKSFVFVAAKEGKDLYLARAFETSANIASLKAQKAADFVKGLKKANVQENALCYVKIPGASFKLADKVVDFAVLDKADKAKEFKIVVEGSSFVNEKEQVSAEVANDVVLVVNSKNTLVDAETFGLPKGFMVIKEHIATKMAGIIDIISKYEGAVKFDNFIEEETYRLEKDLVTGNQTIVITDNTKSSAKPALLIGKNKISLTPGYKLRVQEGEEVKPGWVLAVREVMSNVSQDITGGLPRVVELFEARKPKDAAVLSDIDGVVSFGKEYKAKQHLIVTSKTDETDQREYFIGKNAFVLVQEGDEVKKGQKLTEGQIDLHDILRIEGQESFVKHMIDEIQKVFHLQGVDINDKHFEVIASCMLRKFEVTDVGDTTFVLGEQVEYTEVEAENKKTVAAGGQPAEVKPVLLGITKASLQTNSFISAASFQETTRVLTEAAIAGKVDTLQGVKENVIIGHTIPVGTGYIRRLYDKAGTLYQKLTEHGIKCRAIRDFPANNTIVGSVKDGVKFHAEFCKLLDVNAAKNRTDPMAFEFNLEDECELDKLTDVFALAKDLELDWIYYKNNEGTITVCFFVRSLFHANTNREETIPAE